MAAAIGATLLLRLAGRVSFVILGFYLGERFASAAAVALVLEAFYVSEVVVSLVTGGLSDRLGRRPFLLLAPVVAAVSTAVLLTASRLFPQPTAAAPDVGLAALVVLILAGRLLEGAAAGMAVPAMLGFLTDATTGSEQERARWVTAFQVVTVGGLAAGIPIGGQVSRVLDTWGFLVVLAIYALSLVLLAVGVRHDAAGRKGAAGAHAASSIFDSLRVLRRERVYTFLPAWFSVNALIGAWLVLGVIVLSYPVPAADLRHPDQFLYGGFSRSEASIAIGVPAFVFVLGMGAWTFVLPRFRRRTGAMLTALGGLAMIVGPLVVVNGLAENPASISPEARVALGVLLVPVTIGLLLLSGFAPAALTQLGAIADSLPGHSGAVMGLYSLALAVGQLLGAGVGGMFVDASGFYGLIALSALMGFVSLVSIVYVRRRRHDEVGEPVAEPIPA